MISEHKAKQDNRLNAVKSLPNVRSNIGLPAVVPGGSARHNARAALGQWRLQISALNNAAEDHERL